jgi:hypothetical protein
MLDAHHFSRHMIETGGLGEAKATLRQVRFQSASRMEGLSRTTAVSHLGEGGQDLGHGGKRG